MVYGPLSQKWRRVLEMQSCPLYVGVAHLVSDSVMVQRDSGTSYKVTRNMARGLCPWGDEHISTPSRQF